MWWSLYRKMRLFMPYIMAQIGILILRYLQFLNNFLLHPQSLVLLSFLEFGSKCSQHLSPHSHHYYFLPKHCSLLLNSPYVCHWPPRCVSHSAARRNLLIVMSDHITLKKLQWISIVPTIKPKSYQWPAGSV